MPLLLVASLFLVVRPEAPSSVLAPSSDALVTSSVLVPSKGQEPLVASLLLVAMPLFLVARV